MDRFFEKVQKTGFCWIWKGATRGLGYGALKFRGKVVDAHRVSWILHNGEIPKNMCVCHICDTPSCVNPEHLFLGTHSDNMKDAYKKNRINVPEGQRFQKGQAPVNRNLSTKQVKEIRALIKEGKHSLKEIAEKLSLKYQTIRDLSSGRTYKNI